MNRIVLALTAASIAALGLSSAPATAKQRLTPEQRLAKMLEGYEAGQPTDCISSWNSRDMIVLDQTALVFRNGNTIWVNRPDNAKRLNDDDILVTRTTNSQLCRLDIMNTVERTHGMPTGFINLGKFVPYKKVAKAG